MESLSAFEPYVRGIKRESEDGRNHMERYYSARAGEYEVVYFRDDGVRQLALTQIRNTAMALFPGKAVLEVACGTG